MEPKHVRIARQGDAPYSTMKLSSIQTGTAEVRVKPKKVNAITAVAHQRRHGNARDCIDLDPVYNPRYYFNPINPTSGTLD